MKSYSTFVLIVCLPMLTPTFAQDTYRGIERRGYTPPQVNHHPNPVFNHQAPQPQYRPSMHHRDPYYPNHRYPTHVGQRPQIAVVTPHVGIYVTPEPSHHYQKTEEVYLPYGGTYRSVTEYIPQYSNDPYAPKRRIVSSGYYDGDQH